MNKMDKKYKEPIPLNDLIKISNNALKAAYQIHDELGVRGEEIIKKNQFGDTALRADIETEEAVLQVLRESNIPIKIVSEEHGETIIGTHPRYLGILDGIDGTMIYKKSRGVGRYGTIFGIYEGLDPQYNNYLYGGIMEHSANKLYYAGKKKGCWLLHDEKISALHCLGTQRLDEHNSRLYVDTAFDELFGTKVFKNVANKLLGYNTSYTLSSCVQYADLISGNVDAVIECTRKGNLEIAVAFGMIKEAGGVMVTEEGLDVGTIRYSTFGQKQHVLVFSSCTSQLNNSLLDVVRR